MQTNNDVHEIEDSTIDLTAGVLIHREDGFITAIDLGDFIYESFGYRIPLKRCENSLARLELGGWLHLIVLEDEKKIYGLPGQIVKKNPEKIFSAEEIGKTLPLYSNGLGIVS